ncbi:MAG: ligase [Rhodopseudomonas sp.]|nr:ligase [Rhodopseudomonas sp.]
MTANLRIQSSRLADGLAVALAMSVPWSTSATSICSVLWLLAILPGLDLTRLRRVVLSPAGGIPLVLIALGLAGTLWADVAWPERFNGVSAYIKLLYIPLLLYQIERSDRAPQILIGFLVSCTILLATSWALLIWPEIPFPGRSSTVGIPVKDYISQSAMFTICVFVMLQFAHDAWRNGRRDRALLSIMLAVIFVANILYVATSRTSLVVITVLLVVFGLRRFSWKGLIGLAAGVIVLTGIAWSSADYLRTRVDTFFAEIHSYKADGKATSAGERLTFWKKSIEFIEAAPIVGHGTGSIREQFAQSAVGRAGMAAEVAENPHNQILAIGIQLGLIGIAVLLAMWLAHLALFASNSFAAWVGLVVVIQNVVGSLFNSHLSDFTHGWAYVIGVGVAGGAVLKERAARKA